MSNEKKTHFYLENTARFILIIFLFLVIINQIFLSIAENHWSLFSVFFSVMSIIFITLASSTYSLKPSLGEKSIKIIKKILFSFVPAILIAFGIYNIFAVASLFLATAPHLIFLYPILLILIYGSIWHKHPPKKNEKRMNAIFSKVFIIFLFITIVLLAHFVKENYISFDQTVHIFAPVLGLFSFIFIIFLTFTSCVELSTHRYGDESVVVLMSAGGYAISIVLSFIFSYALHFVFSIF